MAWFAGGMIIGCTVVGVLVVKIMNQVEGSVAQASPGWINHLADESRKRKAPGMRRACRYVEAGWRPGKNG